MRPRAQKFGRNDPCPCGSGKKYKRCCLDSPNTRRAPEHSLPPPEIIRSFLDHQRREKERKEKFGEVKPEIAIDFKGYKFVAVGSTLHYSKKWKYFPDFLQEYVPTVFGKEWGEAELAKPVEQRHPLVQWRTKCLQFLQRQTPDAEGVYAVIPNGFAAAYFAFGYDLYVVQHNGRLDEHLLRRLKHHEQFQGARHELFAEATCMRAGFEIEHEDEKDPSKRHAEFVATCKKSGQKISVEAKSKHRAGVLGRPGDPETDDEVSLRFGRLINDAAGKNVPHPLAIFVDTNLPPATAERFFRMESLTPVIPPQPINRLLDRLRKEHGGRDPYNLIVFTNHPHYYGEEEAVDPKKHLISLFSQIPAMHVADVNTMMRLHGAANLYGNIPDELPGEGS